MMKPPTHLNNPHVIVPSVEVRLVVYIVDNVLVSGVEEIIRMKFVFYVVMKVKNHSLMIQIQVLSLILQIFSTHLHNPRRILKFNRTSFRETPKVLLLAWEKFFEIKHAFKEKQHQPEDIQELLRKLLKDLQIISEELADYINIPKWNCPAFYDNDDEDDDEEYTIAITPVLPTVEPNKSLSMGDEHLSTIPEKKESSVEDLVPIPNHSEIFFDPSDDYALSDDNPLYSEDIDYVDASPPDSELVSLEEVKDFNTEDGEIDIDILLTIKDDILHEKLLNINLLIAKIEALKDNPTPTTDSVLKSPSSFPNTLLEETDTSDNFLPESDIFCFDMEEKSSGNPTSHSDLSLLDYEAFYYNNEARIRKIST
ncbi:hypothetical protein Tco_0388947 [Tanacetum coccineum]